MRRRRSSNRKGQALVEFALTVPILLLLVIGIIEFGRLMSAYQTITDTAREAARRAVVADGPSCPAEEDEIIAIVHKRLALGGLDSTASTINCDKVPGEPTIKVELAYAYHMGWLGPMIGDTIFTILLDTETQMRQE